MNPLVKLISYEPLILRKFYGKGRHKITGNKNRRVVK